MSRRASGGRQAGSHGATQRDSSERDLSASAKLVNVPKTSVAAHSCMTNTSYTRANFYSNNPPPRAWALGQIERTAFASSLGTL